MIRWSVLASRQYKAIHKYIALDSVAAADRQCELIFQAINGLETFPLSSRSTTRPRVRELVVAGTPYIVFYEVTPDAIGLTSIRHGARQKPARFGQ